MKFCKYYLASTFIWASSFTPKDQIVGRFFFIFTFELLLIPLGWMSGNDLSRCLLINKPKCYLKPFIIRPAQLLLWKTRENTEGLIPIHYT